MDIDLDKYRELYLDTFLHFACGDWPNANRYNLHVPFVTNGWKMATDGRILMAVPTDEPDTKRRDGLGRIVYRLPSEACLWEIISPCFEDWPSEEAKPWPSISHDHAIEGDDDSPYIVLNWDREIVTQAHYYWIVERLATAINRRLEFRICTIEYRICDTETSIQFRTIDRNESGQPMLAGVLMLCDAKRSGGKLRKALDGYKQANEEEKEQSSE